MKKADEKMCKSFLNKKELKALITLIDSGFEYHIEGTMPENIKGLGRVEITLIKAIKRR